MIKLTKDQRWALKRLYDRVPLYNVKRMAPLFSATSNQFVSQDKLNLFRVSYREFRRAVVPGYECIMIEWCGMWLGIERDGYTHS